MVVLHELGLLTRSFGTKMRDTQSHQNTQASSESFPVDAVYTWVKAPAPNSEEFKEIQRSCGAVDPQRFRNYGTLRASVLSLKTYAPWIRKVFIVTAGEVPCWIGDVDHVEMVTHRQIYPKELWATDLPTHNSMALETHLHKIHGLAEHFIYLNNDQFLGRPAEKKSFFTPDGKAVYLGSDFAATHQAAPVRKSAIFEQQKMIPDHFLTQSHQRCRKALDPPFWRYRSYHLSHGYGAMGKGKTSFLSHESQNLPKAAEFYAALKRDRPQRFCLNDDFSRNNLVVFEKQRNMLSDFLAEYFKDIPGLSHMPARCGIKDAASFWAEGALELAHLLRQEKAVEK